MRNLGVVVVGAGIGGLVAALALAARGLEVTVVEQAATAGGKMREVAIGGARIDAGPTVFTLKRVFEEIFTAAGTTLADHVTLEPVAILARHAWGPHQRLDLFADLGRSADAIGTFAGAAEAQRFRRFAAQARRIYETLEQPFIRSTQPSLATLIKGARFADLRQIRPFATLWGALGDYFHDPRLRQLFGRYATYCGSSPFLAPATLMLVAHVEQDGVWLVQGGMHRLAEALADLGASRGVRFRYGTEVSEVVVAGGRAAGVRLATGERVEADAVIVNADVAAVSGGRLGRAVTHAAPLVGRGSRSLSAMTWSMLAPTEGFPLVRHNVFFSADYPAEFDDIFRRGRMPAAPTVYVCAQDRGSGNPTGPERLLCLVNAPANGDTHSFDAAEIERCANRTFAHLERCGLRVRRTPESTVVTTPADFDRLFPATGGALYGQASHGWRASFERPGAKTRLAGLYMAGGSVHPGPGVPMAALSGRHAAACLLADHGLTSR